MPNEVFDEIISEWVENKLNCDVLSTSRIFEYQSSVVEETLKCKVLTTHTLLDASEEEVEETLNCKVNRVDWGLSQHLNIEDTLNLK